MECLLKAPSESREARIAFTEDFFRNLNLAHVETALRDQPMPLFSAMLAGGMQRADLAFSRGVGARRATGSRSLPITLPSTSRQY